MRLKVVVVNEEPLGRARLVRMLKALECDVVAELSHGPAFLEWFHSGPALDGLFLDLELPGGGGFELIGELPDPPPVVFVAAHPIHAVQAFESEAVDFLLKPVRASRLQQTLTRLCRWKEGISRAKAPFTETLLAAKPSSRIPVRAGKGQLLLETRKITHFDVEDEIVWAWFGGERFRTYWTALSQAESELMDPGFMRIQRGVLLRVATVVGVKSLPSGRCKARLNDGTELEVSRLLTPAFKTALGVR